MCDDAIWGKYAFYTYLWGEKADTENARLQEGGKNRLQQQKRNFTGLFDLRAGLAAHLPSDLHVWSMEKHLSVYQSVCRLVLPRYSFTWQGTAKSSSLLIAVVKLMHQCECACPRHNTKHSGLSVTILVKGSTVEAGAGKASYCPHCPQTYPVYWRPVESQRLRGGPSLWLSPCWGTHLTSEALDWRWNLLLWFLCLWDSHRATLVTHCAWLPSLWLQMVGLSDSLST